MLKQSYLDLQIHVQLNLSGHQEKKIVMKLY